MANKVEQIAYDKFYPLIKEMGYELVEVEWKKLYDNHNLTFYIDNQTGVKIEDCEKVHKFIDPILDEIDISNGQSYILNVSSAGLDRKLTSTWDFNKNIGKEVEVKFYKQVNGKKEMVGVLVSFSDSTISVQLGEEEILLNKKDIASVKPFIRF